VPGARTRGRPARYREGLLPYLQLRAAGATLAEIAGAIAAGTGERVAPTTVGRWLAARAEGRDPAGDRDLPTATDRISIHLTPEQRELLEDAVHLVRRGTGRQLKLTPGTLARDLLQAAFARGLLDELALVGGVESYQRCLHGACVHCGSDQHRSAAHPARRDGGRRRKK
jgi:hypothetical protein